MGGFLLLMMLPILREQAEHVRPDLEPALVAIAVGVAHDGGVGPELMPIQGLPRGAG